MKTEKLPTSKQNSNNTYVRQETQFKGAMNQINIAEQLYSVFKGYEEADKASKVLENFTKSDLKRLLKCEKVNISLVDEKLMEVVRNENLARTICITINHVPMEVIKEKLTTDIKKVSQDKIYDPCFETVEEAIGGIRREGKICQCVFNPRFKKEKI